MRRFCLILFLFSFSLQGQLSQGLIAEKVATYISLYQQRDNFDGFLGLYSENMVLEDMITGYRLEGREQFAAFFNWPDTRFEKRAANTLIIQSQAIQGNMAVLQGYFTPFSWDSTEVEAMQFTTILYFNDKGEIVRHVDWINYPNDLIDYEKRANTNTWLTKE